MGKRKGYSYGAGIIWYKRYGARGNMLNPDRPLIIKLKISETRMQADLKKKQV